MLKNNFIPNPRKEKRQLEVLAVGFMGISALFLVLGDHQIGTIIFFTLAMMAIIGRCFFQFIGRDVFLIFSTLALGIGTIVSKVILILLYFFGIIVIGLALKLSRVDMLNKNWRKCRAKNSLFQPAPPTTPESFERLS